MLNEPITDFQAGLIIGLCIGYVITKGYQEFKRIWNEPTHMDMVNNKARR